MVEMGLKIEIGIESCIEIGIGNGIEIYFRLSLRLR